MNVAEPPCSLMKREQGSPSSRPMAAIQPPSARTVIVRQEAEPSGSACLNTTVRAIVECDHGVADADQSCREQHSVDVGSEVCAVRGAAQ